MGENKQTEFECMSVIRKELECQPLSYEELVKFFEILETYEAQIDGYFRLIPLDGQVYLYVNESDLFAWGYYGEFPVPGWMLGVLEQCFKDLAEIDEIEASDYGNALYCCRVGGMRPQGAILNNNIKDFWPLFFECGTEREATFGNPYNPGEYPAKD